MSDSIGQQVKRLRSSKKMTLKELSDKVGLSTSFLSQFERGNCTIAIDSLVDIAHALDADLYDILSNVIPRKTKGSRYILRSYERGNTHIQNPREYQTNLSADNTGLDLLAREVTLLPGEPGKIAAAAPHTGEEFIMVLEGILTIAFDGKPYQLYPGDTAHFPSTIRHSWYNETPRLTKMLIVNYPNPELLG